MNVNKLMAELERKHPGESEYLQAVREVLMTVEETYNQHPEFEANRIAERIVEPDRSFTFKVVWVDDKGEVQVNTGYRVQFNNAIGPYKGGLRFHPSVNPSILKFLGFEQIFKNSLTHRKKHYCVPPICRSGSPTSWNTAAPTVRLTGRRCPMWHALC